MRDPFDDCTITYTPSTSKLEIEEDAMEALLRAEKEEERRENQIRARFRSDDARRVCKAYRMKRQRQCFVRARRGGAR